MTVEVRERGDGAPVAKGWVGSNGIIRHLYRPAQECSVLIPFEASCPDRSNRASGAHPGISSHRVMQRGERRCCSVAHAGTSARGKAIAWPANSITLNVLEGLKSHDGIPISDSLSHL